MLSKVISYTPQTVRTDSLWWWLLALAPNAPEQLIVGNDRAFLTWFYDRDPRTSAAIEPAAVEEYLRTFSGREGVLGALGVYRAAFTTMEQTAALTHDKISTPTKALGGAKGQGDHVRAMVEMVAHNVAGGTVADVGHFLPEESPDEIVRQILANDAPHPRRQEHVMTDNPNAASAAPIPPDDPARRSVHVRADDDERVQHISIVGDTYTILLTGEQTAGAYTLIDMLVPTGGGPPPHRHDFEEMFTVLEGEIEVTFRGEKSVARAGDTINVPANAPHQFTNAAEQSARLLCMCTPPGQEEFFARVGDPVPTRTSPPVELSDEERAKRMEKAIALSPQYHSELLLP